MSTLSPTQRKQATSLLNWLSSLDPSEQTAMIEQMAPRDRTGLMEILHDWTLYARPKQLAPPGDWYVWVCQGGRGAGKTRTGAEYVRSRVDAGEWRTVNIAGPTDGDVIDYMLLGTPEAPGLMGIWPPHQRPKLNEKKRRVTCHNGAIIRYRSADEPERFRGPQADGGWADEIDSWKPKGMRPLEAWGLFELGIRLGPDPRIIATSTPKRSRLIRMLRERTDTVVTVTSTYENRANLAAQFFRSIVSQYEGTHLGRQEIGGELLEEIAGQLVTPEMIDKARVTEAVDLDRVSVGVDPSGSITGDSQGIVAAAKGVDGAGYVLADRSCSKRPEGWGRRAVETALEFDADRIVVEVNYGGDMAQSVIEQAAHSMEVVIPVVKVSATRAKHVRFEPVALLYEQGRMHHVGTFKRLEDEVCSFTAEGYDGDGSPDPADALVWAITDLVLQPGGVSPEAALRFMEAEEVRA
jgi:phage terminase large subunit-like protein